MAKIERMRTTTTTTNCDEDLWIMCAPESSAALRSPPR